MFVTNWISTTKIQKISEITNFFRHYFLSRTEVLLHFGSHSSRYLANSEPDAPLIMPSEDFSSIGGSFDPNDDDDFMDND